MLVQEPGNLKKKPKKKTTAQLQNDKRPPLHGEICCCAELTVMLMKQPVVPRGERETARGRPRHASEMFDKNKEGEKMKEGERRMYI